LFYHLKTVGFAVLIFVFLFSGFIQANGEEIKQEDQTIEQEQVDNYEVGMEILFQGPIRPARIYYNYGLGYLNLQKIENLNERIPEDFPSLSNGMLVRRWNSIVGFGDGWRAGWVKTHGSQNQSKGTGEEFRQITYDLEMGGVLIEKTVYIDPLVDLALGAAGGRGTHQVKLLFTQPQTGEMDNPWQDPVSSNLSQPFYFFQPQINARFRLMGPFIGHIQGGYSFTLGRNRWVIEREEISDERFRADGFHFSAGLGVRF